MNRAQKDDDHTPIVFIHSSFRTGSTWLWSKFRENPECYCYYEIFNEILGEINFKNLLQSAADWNSHHPRGAPYFSEFSPLLDHAHGIAGFNKDMALSDFFLNPEGDSDQIRRTEAYLASLVNLAQRNKRVPVLSCTRSIGRAGLTKELIGGTHILIRRRLLNQWFSYSNQALNKNTYFFNTIVRTVNSRYADGFIAVLQNILKANDISEESFGVDHDTLLIVFLCLHIYLYVKHQDDFDVIIDFRKEVTHADLVSAARQVAENTQVRVDLSDYRDPISAPDQLITDVDRVFSMVRSLFAKPILGIDAEKLRTVVDEELSEFEEGYNEYRRIAGSAHAQMEAYGIERSELERIGNAAADELRTRLDAATRDLASALSEFREAELRMQRERLLLDEQSTELAERFKELEAALEPSGASRDVSEEG